MSHRAKWLTTVFLGLLPPLFGQSAANDYFHQEFLLTLPSGSAFAFRSLTVPDGSMIVLEYVSVFAKVPAGQRPLISIQSTLKTVQANFRIATQVQSTYQGTDRLVANQPVRICADPSSTLTVVVNRDVVDGVADLSVVISGYLAPLPVSSAGPIVTASRSTPGGPKPAGTKPAPVIATTRRAPAVPRPARVPAA